MAASPAYSIYLMKINGFASVLFSIWLASINVFILITGIFFCERNPNNNNMVGAIATAE